MATIPFKGEAIGTVDGLTAALAGKSALGHGHGVGDISGLGSMAVAATGDYCAKDENLSSLANVATARTNLGLGHFATVALNVGGEPMAAVLVDDQGQPTVTTVTAFATSFWEAADDSGARDTLGALSGIWPTSVGGRGRGNYGAAGRIPYAISTTLEADAAGLQLFLGGLSVGAGSDGSYTGAAWLAASGLYIKAAGSTNDAARITRTDFSLARDTPLRWGSFAAVTASPDVGLIRHSAGVLRVTDSSTGKGDMLVGPSSATKQASAALQIDSTTQGVLKPRLTTLQRDAISVSALDHGLEIFNTDTQAPEVYTSSGWGTQLITY